MKSRRLVLSAVTLAALSGACSFLHRDEDKQPTPVNTPSVPAISPTSPHGPATNESAIKRYADEKKFAAEEEGVLARDTMVRTEAGAGEGVSSLVSGTPVATLSTIIQGFVLIKFVDAAGTRKMGWIEQAAFVAIPLSASASAKASAIAAARTDASAPPQADAGVRRDGGADAGKVTDGGTKEAGAPVLQVTKPANKDGKCDAGWVLFPANERTCRKACTADADCGGLTCAQKGSVKICSIGK
jgi:hypothetical protein